MRREKDEFCFRFVRVISFIMLINLLTLDSFAVPQCIDVLLGASNSPLLNRTPLLRIEKLMQKGILPWHLSENAINPKIDLLYKADVSLSLMAGYELFPFLELSELNTLGSNYEVAQRLSSYMIKALGGSRELARQDELYGARYSPDGLQLISKILLLRLDPTNRLWLNFEEQAKYFDLPFETMSRTYRFDARSFDQLQIDGGFRPNEDQGTKTIPEHSFKFARGSNQFVSLTLKSGNKFLLSNIVNKFSRRLVESEFEVFLSEQNIKYSSIEIQSIAVINEYEISNAIGVRPINIKGFQIEKESEFITNGVDSEQITRHRKAYTVYLKNINSPRIYFSKWTDAKGEDER